MTREELIEKNKDLFWYLEKSKLNEISDLTLAEFIFNYGSWSALKDFIALFGLQRAQDLFTSLKKEPRTNLFEETTHYFNHFFQRHAS
jgi:hypothetical protein